MSVYLSVTSRSSTETDARIKLFLASGLRSTYLTLCYKETWTSTKLRVLSTNKVAKMMSKSLVWQPATNIWRLNYLCLSHRNFVQLWTYKNVATTR